MHSYWFGVLFLAASQSLHCLWIAFCNYSKEETIYLNNLHCPWRQKSSPTSCLPLFTPLSPFPSSLPPPSLYHFFSMLSFSVESLLLPKSASPSSPSSSPSPWRVVECIIVGVRSGIQPFFLFMFLNV